MAKKHKCWREILNILKCRFKKGQKPGASLVRGTLQDISKSKSEVKLVCCANDFFIMSSESVLASYPAGKLVKKHIILILINIRLIISIEL